MITIPPYDPKKNLREGASGILFYHSHNPARLISYASLILAFGFGYHMFDFVFKTAESVNLSYFVGILTITIPAMVVLSISARKKIRSIDSNKKRQLYAWLYSALITLLVWTEVVYFNIDWVHMATHAFDLPSGQQQTTLVLLGTVLAIFWLPVSEALGFHLKEIKEWLCSRDPYLTQVENQLGYG
jgi:hypothetical protein